MSSSSSDEVDYSSDEFDSSFNEFDNFKILPNLYPKTCQEYLDKFKANSWFFERWYIRWQWYTEQFGYPQAWLERNVTDGSRTAFIALVRGDGKVLSSTIISAKVDPLDPREQPPDVLDAHIDENGYLRGITANGCEWK